MKKIKAIQSFMAIVIFLSISAFNASIYYESMMSADSLSSALSYQNLNQEDPYIDSLNKLKALTLSANAFASPSLVNIPLKPPQSPYQRSFIQQRTFVLRC
jgi:hypothetical protein